MFKILHTPVSNFLRNFLRECAPRVKFVICSLYELFTPVTSRRHGSRRPLGDPFFAIFLPYAKGILARVWNFGHSNISSILTPRSTLFIVSISRGGPQPDAPPPPGSLRLPRFP